MFLCLLFVWYTLAWIFLYSQVNQSKFAMRAFGVLVSHKTHTCVCVWNKDVPNVCHFENMCMRVVGSVHECEWKRKRVHQVTHTIAIRLTANKPSNAVAHWLQYTMLPFGLRTKGIVLMCCMDDMLYLRIFACTNNAHFQFHVAVAQLEQRLQFKHFFLGFCVSLLVFSFLFLNCIHRLHCTCLNSTVCVCIWVCVRIFVCQCMQMEQWKIQNLAATAKAEATTIKMLYNRTCKAQQTRLKKAHN